MNAQCNSLSVHFQVLIAGTVLFLAAFFWGTTPQHSPSGQIVNQEFSTYFGLSAIAVYLAFVAIVVGHALLETKFGHKGHEEHE